MDEACRNIVAVGGRPHSLTDCLNFGNPEKPDRLGELHEAVAGIGDVSTALNLAIPSGNVQLLQRDLRRSLPAHRHRPRSGHRGGRAAGASPPT